MRSPEICKAKAVNELLVTHDVLLQNQWNKMAVDLLFRVVLPRRTRIFNLIENLLNRLSEAEVNSRYRFSRNSIQLHAC